MASRCLMEPTGVEPATSWLQTTEFSRTAASINGFSTHSSTPSDTSNQAGLVSEARIPNLLDTLPNDLRTVVDGWSKLPDALRAGIVAMIAASTKNEIRGDH